jgi:protein-disulfide isomerase
MNKRFVIVLLICVIGFFGILIATKKKAGSPSSGNSASLLSNHVKGDDKKGVTLTEYGDLQCPACWEYEPIMKQVFDKYKTDIKFQFRNFPLTSLHPNAFAAHRAVEAAAKQGKFWEMHDILYEHAHQIDQNTGKIVDIEWTATTNPSTYFNDYAQQIGLNVEQFKKDSNSEEVNAIINADLDSANKYGFTGTPSFLLNGKRIETPNGLAGFNKIIDDAIKANNKS